MRRWIAPSVGAVIILLVVGLLRPPVAQGKAEPGVGQHWVASWMAAPTDSLNGADADFRPIVNIADQTFRVMVTPHRAGEAIRVKLSNAKSPRPLRIGSATAAAAGAGASITTPATKLTFNGRRSVVIPAGGEILSDAVDATVTAWQRLAVSVHVQDSALFLTQHLNGNATSYYTKPGTGDRTRRRDGAAFPLTTTVVPIVSRVDVLAPTTTTAIVTLGDSITDGYVADNFGGLPQAKHGVVDKNVRYPDFLQRRLDDAGIDRVVVNAGISGNRVTADGAVPMYGDAATRRLQRDVLSVPGVEDIILLEGINDLGVPIGASADQVIAAYRKIIDRLHAHRIRVHLGTILPASNALLDGVATAPFSDATRRVINNWIRMQKLADSVIDFDSALRDKSDSGVLAPRYAGPDRLHPNPAGYQRMAQAVDLSSLN